MGILTYLGRRNLNGRMVSIELSNGNISSVFSSLVIKVTGLSLLWAIGSWLRGSRRKLAKQAPKQHFLQVFAWFPDSRSLTQVPALAFLENGEQHQTYKDSTYVCIKQKQTNIHNYHIFCLSNWRTEACSQVVMLKKLGHCWLPSSFEGTKFLFTVFWFFGNQVKCIYVLCCQRVKNRKYYMPYTLQVAVGRFNCFFPRMPKWQDAYTSLLIS